MFFYLSKLFWLVAKPMNFLVLAAIVSFLLFRFGFARTGKFIAVLVAILFFTIGFTQLPDYLLASQEASFETRQLDGEPFGVIILGGAIDNGDLAHRSNYELGDGSERILRGIELARQYPNARIIYTGGDNSITGSGESEADIAEVLIHAVSNEAKRFEFERTSRNTWENAVNCAALMGTDKTKPWLLVTSAFHMERAMNVFKRAGINVYPVAVDHRAYQTSFPWISFHPVWQFAKLDLWLHEFIGRLAYRGFGKG